MTSIWSRAVLLMFLSLFLVSTVSSSHYYGESDDGIFDSNEPGFSIPEYESQREVLTQLVAPFLLVAIVLQIGLQRALMFTLDEDYSRWSPPGHEHKEDRARIKKQSLILSLIITGMMVPTAFFRILNEFIAAVFGSMIYLFGVLLLLLFLYFVVGTLWNLM